MDPATAFQVFCGAIQLIQFGIGTTKAFQDIYRSKNALTSEYNQLSHEMTSLRTTSSQISSRLQRLNQAPLTREQAHLHDVAKDCDRLAGDLLKRLDGLKLTGHQRHRDVPLQWLKLMREKGRIEREPSPVSAVQGASKLANAR